MAGFLIEGLSMGRWTGGGLDVRQAMRRILRPQGGSDLCGSSWDCPAELAMAYSRRKRPSLAGARGSTPPSG